MLRYTRVPISLYRIQGGPLPIALRDFDSQMKKGRSSFDLKLYDGKVLPMEGDTFHTPNGMSLRPGNDKMIQIVEGFRKPPTVYRMHEGMEVPEGLVIIHEHTDHYSMQTTEPIEHSALNDKLTAFIESLPCQTREEFLDSLDDQDS